MIESWMKVKEGTNPDRVKMPLTCQHDWQAEYDMLLPDGKTCANCRNCRRCCGMFGASPDNTMCDFYPSRYSEAEKGAKV
jgi:hypothetical protein